MIRTLCKALVVALCSTPALAHEFWIVPDRFVAQPSQPVAFTLYVGSGWPGERFPRDPGRIVRFTLVDADGERPIDGEPGAIPSGRATVGKPGSAIAIYRSTNALATLDPRLFETYLREEGLEHVMELRAKQGRSNASSRELFSRNAKSLITVGGGRAGFDRVTGLTLEIVPINDPRLVKGGGSLTVEVRFRGRPIEGLLVRALAEKGGHERIGTRTDADGRATVVLPFTGVWLINAVQMLEAPPASGVDWESWWASLTFENGR